MYTRHQLSGFARDVGVDRGGLALGEVLEEMDELWDPFEGPYEFVDDDALPEEILNPEHAAIFLDDSSSKADDGKGGGLDELLG